MSQALEFRPGWPHSEHPTGWFQLGWDDDFPVGAVKPLKFFSQDLVAYRGASGQLRVFDAYCPHFGAHLGHGGCVAGDDIVCPFHGWRFDSDGAVKEIPYSRRAKTGHRLRPWTTAEVDGIVLVWHDSTNQEPTWAPPTFVRAGQAVYSPDKRYRESVRMYPQMMSENSIDVPHFKYVHRAGVVPDVESYGPDGTTFHDRVVWPNGGFLTNDCHGVGIVRSEFGGVFDGMSGAYTITAVTPIDTEYSAFFLTNWVHKGPNDDDELPPAGRRFYETQREQSDPDFRIWENMLWREHPATVPEETKVYRAFRQWAAQFYPDEKTRALKAVGGP